MLLPTKLARLTRIFFDFKRRRETVGALPIRLWIETASCCNLRCVMCPNKSVSGSEKGLMKLDLFKKIIDEARSFASDAYLHHRGEPLMNPALFDMIRYARAAGIKTRFHSNGSLLTEEKARQILDAGPDMVSFSVDGFTKESYERVRIGATFEKATKLTGILAGI